MTPSTSEAERTDRLRGAGLRITRPRLAVLEVLATRPHSRADDVISAVRQTTTVSTQAVYDVLNALQERALVRRIQPAGSVARYELRTDDNHHHLVCRRCGSVTDIDCATEAAPCLDPADLGSLAPGFAVDEAEVTFWGVCTTCQHPSTTTGDQA